MWLETSLGSNLTLVVSDCCRILFVTRLTIFFSLLPLGLVSLVKTSTLLRKLWKRIEGKLIIVIITTDVNFHHWKVHFGETGEFVYFGPVCGAIVTEEKGKLK